MILDYHQDLRDMSEEDIRLELASQGVMKVSRFILKKDGKDRKRRLNGAVCRNHRIKRVVPCRCWDGHVKEPYEMSMAWEPDRRSNFFFSPPAHLCAVTYMTEISLIVTLNNQFNSTQHIRKYKVTVKAQKRKI